MAIYSLSLRTSIALANAAFWAAQAAAGNEPTVYEVRFVASGAATAFIGLGMSSNVPVLSSPTNVLAEDEARPAGLTQCATTFSTAPTSPTQFFRRASITANVGNGIVWVFTRGIVLPAAGAALVMWFLNTTGVAGDADCVVDE